MNTKSLLSQVQLSVIFKFNHYPFGPEKNAGNSINCDIYGAVVTVSESPPRFSFWLSSSAQVVVDNLINHIEIIMKKIVITILFHHIMQYIMLVQGKHPVHPDSSCTELMLSPHELGRQRCLRPTFPATILGMAGDHPGLQVNQA